MHATIANVGTIVSGLCWGLALGHRHGALLALLGAMAFVGALDEHTRHRLARGTLAGMITCGLWFWELPEIWNTWGTGQGHLLWLLTTMVHSLPFALMALCAGNPLELGHGRSALRLGLAGCLATSLAGWLPVPVDLSMAAAFQPLTLGPARWAGASGWVGCLLVLAGLLVGRQPMAFGALALWSLSGIVAPPSTTHTDTLQVTVIEPGLDVFASRQSGRRAASDVAVQRALDAIPFGATDLIVLPETSWYSATAPRHDSPVVYGTSRDDQNLVVLGEQHAAKQYLVPLVERPILGVGAQAFLPGEAARRLVVDSVILGPLVCFEDLHGPALRQADLAGAELLVVATQDSWLSIGQAASKHLAASVLAAVRSGRPVIRAASTGPSAFIAPSGHVLASTPTRRARIPGVNHLQGSIRPSRPMLAAVVLEPWLGGVSVLLLLAMWGRHRED